MTSDEAHAVEVICKSEDSVSLIDQILQSLTIQGIQEYGVEELAAVLSLRHLQKHELKEAIWSIISADTDAYSAFIETLMSHMNVFQLRQMLSGLRASSPESE